MVVVRQTSKPAKKKSSKRYKSAGRPMTNIPRVTLVGGGIKGWRTADVPVVKGIVINESVSEKKKKKK